MTSVHELAHAIIRTALEAADPRRALERAWPRVPPLANETGKGAPSVPLPADFPLTPWRIVAFGKASRDMLAVALERCKGRTTIAAIATDRPELVPTHPWLTAMRADHPLPTEHNLSAAEAIASCVREASPQETVVALVSGGGSAHLASPVPPISLDDLTRLSSSLMKAGASIHELNCVRRHAEWYKGGKLAEICPARSIEVFVMSDVIGDPLHDIASGPFAPDPTTPRDARAVLRKYHALDVAPAITSLIESGGARARVEGAKGHDSRLERVRHHVIASNRLCVDAIGAMLESRGIAVRERRYDAQGEASEWAAWLDEQVRTAGDEERACAWIMGGEPVVRVGEAKGRGGPSQEVALHAAKLISGIAGTMLVAFSTDGVDGPSGNAGAIVDAESWEKAITLGMDPSRALDHHDSSRVHESLNGAIRTGPTGTNLNHVAVLLRLARRRQTTKGR